MRLQYFIWHTLLREMKTLELKVVATILSITTLFLLIISVSLNNISNQLSDKVHETLGGALVLESSTPISDTIIKQAEANHLTYTQNLGFFTMASINEKYMLVQVEAFDSKFPLQGQMTFNTNKKNINRHGYPAEGEIWVNKRFFDNLNIALDQFAQIAGQPLRVSAELVTFPFLLSRTSSFSPIVYMNWKDAMRLDVIHPGSRVNYRLIMDGMPIDIQRFMSADNIRQGAFKLITPSSGRQMIAKPIKLIKRYLSLLIIIQCILTSVVIGLSFIEYSKRQQHSVAILRTIGANHKSVTSLYLGMLLLLITLLSLPCLLLSYLALNIIFGLWQPFGITVVGWHWDSVLLVMAIILTLSIGFALPAILSLKKVPVQQLLRAKNHLRLEYKWIYFLTLALTMLLICVQAEDFIMPFRFFGAFILLVILGLGISILTWYALRGLRKVGPHAFRFAMNTLLKYQWQGIIQCVVCILIFTLFIFSATFKWDILKSWRDQLPSDTPNYFMVNVQPNELDTLSQWFTDNQLSNITFYPIVRARYSHINYKPVNTWGEGQYDPTAKPGLKRAINLTWMNALPDDNQRIAGISWDKVLPGELAISVEAKFAKSHQISLGDQLTFQIQDKAITAKVVQLRALSWQSFRPNFYIIFPDKLIHDFPHTFIASFYLPKQDIMKISELQTAFPQVSIIDLDIILEQLVDWTFKMSNVLDIILGVMLIGGILLMFIMMKSMLKERIHASTLLKCLGSPVNFIKYTIIIEYVFLGSVVGAASGILAQLLMHDVANQFFEMHYAVGWLWILVGWGAAVILLVSSALFGLRRVIKVPPIQILREQT